MPTTNKELEATAYHEAGHAVAHWRFGCPITRVTIAPEDDYLGVVVADDPVMYMHLDWDASPEIDQALNQGIMIYFAGPLAQVRFDSSSWSEFHGDSDYETASPMLLRLGGSSENASAISERLESETRAFLEKHWREVEAVANALLEHRDLDGTSVTTLLETLTNEVIPTSELFSYQSEVF